MHRFENAVFALMLVAAASPAFAGQTAPAPIAGIGIGAVALIGLGYRALKTRVGR